MLHVYIYIAGKFPKRRKIDFPFKEESGQIISCLCEIAAEITGWFMRRGDCGLPPGRPKPGLSARTAPCGRRRYDLTLQPAETGLSMEAEPASERGSGRVSNDRPTDRPTVASIYAYVQGESDIEGTHFGAGLTNQLELCRSNFAGSLKGKDPE